MNWKRFFLNGDVTPVEGADCASQAEILITHVLMLGISSSVGTCAYI